MNIMRPGNKEEKAIRARQERSTTCRDGIGLLVMKFDRGRGEAGAHDERSPQRVEHDDCDQGLPDGLRLYQEVYRSRIEGIVGLYPFPIHGDRKKSRPTR